MDDILDELGVGHLKEKFTQDRVNPEDVKYLTERDFVELGVTAIGDRARIRERCREKCEENDSPALKRVRALQEQRKGRVKRNDNSSRKTKDTRRIIFGWKHMTKCSYQMVTANKGGGNFALDVSKQCLTSELKEKVVEHYFPVGRNKIQGLQKDDLHMFLATFTGDRIEECPLGDVINNLKTSPLRLYLHTCKKEEINVLETTDSDATETSGTGATETTGTGATETTGSGETENTDTGETENTDTGETEHVDTDDSYIDGGTPTILLRRRNRLSLSQRGTDQQEYRSQLSEIHQVIEIEDSEDEDLQEALLQSLTEEHNSGTVPESTDMPDIKEVLTHFQIKAVEDNCLNKLLVMRTKILDTAMRGLDRKAVNLKARLFIKFTGEPGEDQGGPRREFFRLVMKDLRESMFFEGPIEEKVFSHNLICLEKGQYRLVGQIVGLSLAQDGPGMHFLSPNLFDLMVGHHTDLKDVENVLPEEIKQMLQELINADNWQKTDIFLSKYCEQLLDFGISNVYKMAKDDKEGLIQIIKKHQIFYRTAGEISQFINGMNDVSKAWEMVSTHAAIFKPIFCFQKEEITGEDFLKLFKINFSETGSNQRQTEEITVYGWEAFLQSVEAGYIAVTYPEILSFVTGADSIPPCGFSKLIDIDFYSDVGRLPSASTCALQLWLPRVTDPDHITSVMVKAIKESYGFLKV